jgi:hypothetical protein
MYGSGVQWMNTCRMDRYACLTNNTAQPERSGESMNKSQRIERLRSVEQECFRICYHLLQSDNSAHEAAKLTLTQLYRNDAFFADLSQGAELLRREAVRVCLLLQQEQIRQVEHDAIA